MNYWTCTAPSDLVSECISTKESITWITHSLTFEQNIQEWDTTIPQCSAGSWMLPRHVPPTWTLLETRCTHSCHWYSLMAAAPFSRTIMHPATLQKLIKNGLSNMKNSILQVSAWSTICRMSHPWRPHLTYSDLKDLMLTSWCQLPEDTFRGLWSPCHRHVSAVRHKEDLHNITYLLVFSLKMLYFWSQIKLRWKIWYPNYQCGAEILQVNRKGEVIHLFLEVS